MHVVRVRDHTARVEMQICADDRRDASGSNFRAPTFCVSSEPTGRLSRMSVMSVKEVMVVQCGRSAGKLTSVDLSANAGTKAVAFKFPDSGINRG